MKFKNLMLWGGVIGLLSLTSCNNNENLYDPVKSDALLKAEYSAKFFAKFGNVPTDYSWDATSTYPQYKSTRAGEGLISNNEWYEVDNNTLTWLNNKLPEKKNNKKLGKSFFMQVPRNPFTIIPIYQGEAGLEWELHMVIGEKEAMEDIRVWGKSENIQYKSKSNSSWKDVSTLTAGTDQNTIGKAAVQAKKYTFDYSSRAGETMYFYLLITKGSKDGAYANVDTKQSSLNEMILALTDCPRPANIDKENEVMVIACEDANLKDSDWDMNDVVFLVYGDPKIPQPVDIEEDERTKITSTRYMIEDLGSTDDFDFNDIVLDVTQEVVEKLITENGVLISTEEVSKSQKATLRHLGGTIPFSLWIGDTQLFNNEPGQMGKTFADGEREFILANKEWDPKTNNIRVTVRDLNNKELVHEYKFPENGAAPMIIAVPLDTEWMSERTSITSEWFNNIKANN